jgi:hypothetical protein
MPYGNFEVVAEVLDNRRLNKQALEGWQIMMTNLKLDPQGNFREPRGWFNHPAAVMWRGHDQALLEYISEMVREWKRRGYKSTILDKANATFEVALKHDLTIWNSDAKLPLWLSDFTTLDKVAVTHRVALLNKDYEWYSQYYWYEDEGARPDSYEYYWPN